jgi:hypothetical protein
MESARSEDEYEIREVNSELFPTTPYVPRSVGGSGSTAPDCFELWEKGSLVWRVNIAWEYVCSPFQAQLYWQQANAVLFGANDEFYALAVADGAVILHRKVPMYFGYFAINPFHDMLFVLAGQEVLAFNSHLQEIWSTQGLAVDGVVLKEIGENSLIVEAEMDPPGGWQRVIIDIKTGRELLRLTTPN